MAWTAVCFLCDFCDLLCCLGSFINNNINRTIMSSTAKANFQEFKNAIHASKGSAQSTDNLLLEFSPHKGLRKEVDARSQISLFGQSSLSRHFKDIELTANKSKSLLEGFGITIDDHGHLILAQWKSSQIDGRYFLFKPNLIEQNDQNSSFSAICQYGYMKNGNLQGENYVYNINGTLAKGHFEQNKIVGKCYIIHSNKLFVANQINELHKVECEIVNFSATESELKNSENSNVPKIPKIRSFSQKESKGGVEGNKFLSIFEQVDVNIFVKPNKFLEDMIKSHQSNTKDGDSIATLAINEREYFVGFVQNDKNRPKNSNEDETLRINGLGAIFKNQWPTCYGFFKEGKLQGLGRVYQTQMNLYDGFFSNGEIIEGFIIDYYAHTTSFGHHSAIDHEYKTQSHEEDCFIITNTFDSVSLDYIVEYKKNFHLKSLNFNNSYFNSPKLIHRSPWPYNIINKLNKRTQIESIIKSFRPSLRDMEISAIEKVGQSTQNRLEKELVQQIKETNPSVRLEEDKSRLLKQKSNFIKNEITKNLKEKSFHQQEGQNQRVLSRYINEYKVLQRKKTELIRSKDKHLQSKEQPFQHSQSVMQASLPNSSINNQLTLTPRKYKQQSTVQVKQARQQDLSYLVQQYHQCQTQRKNSITGGNTTRRTNTDRKYSPRELYSKRSLIQEDYNHFKGKEKTSKTPKTSNSARRKVDLDLIYRQYLQK